jgi:uncharacterized membrane protein (DUF441 family)
MLIIALGFLISWLIGKLGNSMQIANGSVMASMIAGAIAFGFFRGYTDFSVIIGGAMLGFLGWLVYMIAIAKRWVK